MHEWQVYKEMLVSEQKPTNLMSQDHYALFARGVFATLSLWPAFQIALDLKPVNPEESNAEMTQRFAIEILDAFISSLPGSPDPSHLESFLKEFVEVEMQVMLEDDSEKHVTHDLIKLWTACSEPASGQETIQRLEEIATKKSGLNVNRLATENDGDTDESEEDSEEEEESSAMDLDADVQTSRKPEPIIDEDGFETVVRRKR